MKRKATEWVDPLIHMSDSVYISQEKQSYHIKFKWYDSYTKISEINARMQKKQQNGLTYMHYITFQIIFCQLSTFPQALQGFHHVLPQSR